MKELNMKEKKMNEVDGITATKNLLINKGKLIS